MSSSIVFDAPESQPAEAPSQPTPSADGPACPHRSAMPASAAWWLAALSFLSLLVGSMWAGDAITLQGERSVFTVECQAGGWQAKHCDGRLLAGAQYTFRVVDSLREVQFWTVGAPRSIGHLTDCAITDGRNWVCKSGPDLERSATAQMLNGVPLVRSTGSGKLPHAVFKWRWYLLRLGLSLGHDADI